MKLQPLQKLLVVEDAIASTLFNSRSTCAAESFIKIGNSVLSSVEMDLLQNSHASHRTVQIILRKLEKNKHIVLLHTL